ATSRSAGTPSACTPSCTGPTSTAAATSPRWRPPTCWSRMSGSSSAAYVDRHHRTGAPMSRTSQVTSVAHEPRAPSTLWRDALGYVHPGPPGVELPDGADPLAAWDEFLAGIGVPEDQRNTRSAIEDPDGRGPRVFFQQVPERKTVKNRV